MSRQTLAPEAIRTAKPTWIGRQPLFDSKMDVRAYQLLAKGNAADAEDTDDDERGAAAFWNTFIELGLDAVANRQHAYLGVSRDFLLGQCASLFADDRIAFEVPTDVAMDSAMASCIDRMVKDGYRIVLDGDAALEHKDLLTLASAVKLNGNNDEGIARIDDATGLLHEQGISVVAQGLDSRTMFERCKSSGADRFQGHFLHEPEFVSSDELPVDRVARLELLAVVNDADASLDRFEDAIAKDITLSYKLLRYINSAMFAFRRDIESIRHAVMMLGQRWTRTWANLVILSAVTDCPPAIMTSAMIRGRMCEQIAQKLDRENSEVYFTAGLLSSLDVLWGRDLEEVLDQLPLCDELTAALLDHEGLVGKVLAASLDYEKSAWVATPPAGLNSGDLRDAYLDGLVFARESRRCLDVV